VYTADSLGRMLLIIGNYNLCRRVSRENVQYPQDYVSSVDTGIPASKAASFKMVGFIHTR
jgi:hypothetical protein